MNHKTAENKVMKRWLVLLAALCGLLLLAGVVLAQEEPVLPVSAIGYTDDGRQLQSPTIQRQVVSDRDSSRPTLWIVILILVLSLGGRLISSWIANRGNKAVNQPAVTGPFGGTLCPQCGRPFAMHIWGFNVVVGKYDRCPHCGKWSLVRRVHPDILRNAAEAFMADEADEETAVPRSTDDPDSFTKRLDDSRFDDG
jgi:hypothetical protein